MRVLLSASSFHPEFGGPARSVPQLGSALADAGLEVGLWAPDGSATTSSLLSGIPGMTRLGGSAEEAWRNFGRIDVLHDNGLWRSNHRSLAALAARAGVARVVSPRGMLEPWALRHKPIRKRLAWWTYQRRLLQTASALHATAKSEAEQFAKLGLRRPAPIIPNGVNLPDWDEVERLREPTREPHTCLFMSRVHPKKGLPLLLEAWSALRPAGWRLDIAGPDEAGHRAELERMVRRLRLDDTVRFLGPLEGNTKQRALAGADLAVLPTYSENFGIVVAEALAHGCPVLTTHGAPWKVLETEDCGWWVPVTTEAIGTALREATSLSVETRREMGRRGHQVVARDFAWPKIAAAFISVYEEAAQAHRNPRD